MSFSARFTAACLLAPTVLVASCASQRTDDNDAATASISGTVSYVQRIAMPPQNTVTIKLLDVSRADAPAVELGKQIISNAGNPPINFVIRYNPADVRPTGTYAIAATIEADGRILFRTTEQFNVLTREAPKDDISVLVKMTGN
jgi:putative lipoprotein